MCEVALDVDVVIKLVAYDLAATTEHPDCPEDCDRRRGVTATTRFVAAKRLSRQAADAPAAQARLEEFLDSSVELEPTENELALAATIEMEAANAGLELDPGESQLCAVAIKRDISVVLTGDKRAIAAAQQLLEVIGELRMLAGRVACLEQAVTLAVERLGALPVRARVIDEPDIDKAISICFQYTNPTVSDTFWPTGLRSYINSVRATAPALLLPGETLKFPSVA